MNKVKWIAGLMLLSGIACAQTADDYKHCLCHISTTKLFEKFPFTDEQKQKNALIQQAYAKTSAQLKHDINEADKAIKAVLKQEPLDEAKLKALVDKKINLTSQKMHGYFEAEIAIFKSLNAEQKTQWHQIFDAKLTP
jgi:Spy/CpxP family protein refolding chaperone